MTEILFYHLERHPLERVLPILVEKSLERGWKVVVEAGSAERLQRLDEVMWTFRDDSFLPHGLDGSGGETDQPVLLTTEAHNPNGADIRFFVDRAIPETVGEYQRLVYMFDGHDPDAVTQARTAWKALRDGNDLTYWQQDANGRWEKKAGS